MSGPSTATVSIEARRVGPVVVGALFHMSINGAGGDRRHVAITAAKRPVALFVRDDERIDAFTPEGEPMTLRAFREICSNAPDRAVASALHVPCA